MSPLLVAEDRSMAVPSGAKVVTGYVAIEQIALVCRDRMAVSDVERAMQRRMSCAPAQPWPCPIGKWLGDRFWISDGRHDAVGAMMLGVEFILVGWIEESSPGA